MKRSQKVKFDWIAEEKAKKNPSKQKQTKILESEKIVTRDSNFGEFLNAIRFECEKENLSKKTSECYVQVIRKFLEWLKTEHNIVALGDITQKVFDIYVIKLKDTTSPGAAKRFVKYWNACYKKITGKYPELQDFNFEARKIKVPQNITPALQDEDIEEIFSKIDKSTFYGFRIYTIFQFMLNTGARIDETLNLKVRDILFMESRVLLRVTKGSKQRYVPMSDSLAKILLFYIYEVRGEHDDIDYLFLSEDNKKLSYSAVNTYVQRHITKNLKLSEGRKFYFHAFRIKYATNFLKNGGSIAALQRILGHTPNSVVVTMNYVRYTDSDITSEDIERVKCIF